jgi:hypothetical protein
LKTISFEIKGEILLHPFLYIFLTEGDTQRLSNLT